VKTGFYFIKPSDLTTSYDLSNKTIKPEILENGNGKSEEFFVSDQSSYIELLQILLHIKGQDAHFKNSATKLTMVLTCWDELTTSITPKEELGKILPLLLSFIETNWAESKIIFWSFFSGGLIKRPCAEKQIQEMGSENFGYILKSDGSKDNDITQLILEAV